MPSLERYPIVSPDGVLAQEEDGQTSSGRRQVDLVYPSNSRMRQITNQPNQTSNEDGTELSQDYHTVRQGDPSVVRSPSRPQQTPVIPETVLSDQGDLPQANHTSPAISLFGNFHDQEFQTRIHTWIEQLYSNKQSVK